MTTLLGLEQGDDDEFLAPLRELLILPSPTTTPVVNRQVDQSCDGRRRRRRRGSKRGREDEQHEEEQPPRHSCKTSCCSTKTKKQQMKKMSSRTSSSLVTSVPDFDGYQWRKYGQKQIEGAMYARSYYRCIRSAEQGCPAKRTVQRNDDGGDGGAAPKYTVVYMGEHTCTANDSMEATVILETAAAVATTTSAAGSCSSTRTSTATGIESPAISDITYGSSNASSDYVVDDDDNCRLFGVHEYSWAPAAASSLQEMEDFTGPIRSPVHIDAADGWTTFDHHFLLQLAASNDQPLFPISLNF